MDNNTVLMIIRECHSVHLIFMVGLCLLPLKYCDFAIIVFQLITKSANTPTSRSSLVVAMVVSMTLTRPAESPKS